MKELSLYFWAVFLLAFAVHTKAQKTVYDGINKGSELYFANPSDTAGYYCIDSIYVNGNKYRMSLKTNAFEVRLKDLGIKRNELAEIVVFHAEDCKPELLNPEAFLPKSTYRLIRLELKNDSLFWLSENEKGKLDFVVEQYRWKKWHEIGKRRGKGTEGKHEYSFRVSIHSGTNRFRIKQTDYTGIANISEEISYESPMPKVEFKPGNGKKVWRMIEFSRVTEYRVYDYFGQFLFMGKANKIDVSDLESGTYFIKYDNQIASFIRR